MATQRVLYWIAILASNRVNSTQTLSKRFMVFRQKYHVDDLTSLYFDVKNTQPVLRVILIEQTGYKPLMIQAVLPSMFFGWASIEQDRSGRVEAAR